MTNEEIKIIGICNKYADEHGGGGGGSVDIVTKFSPTPSDKKVPSEKLVKDSLDKKLDLIQDEADKGKAVVVGETGELEFKKIEGGSGEAADVNYENESHTDVENVQEALDKLFSKVYYVAPAINSFSATPVTGTYEIGSKIPKVDLAWALNKGVAKQTLTGCTVTPEDRSATYSTEISANKSFTLAIEDAEGGKASKTISYSFLPRVYYGGAALPSTPDSNFVVGLAKGDFKSSAIGTYTMTPNDGDYGFIAIPSAYAFGGTAKVGGFDTDLTLVGTVSVTNASGYTQDYKLWRMPNPSGGSQISIVI